MTPSPIVGPRAEELFERLAVGLLDEPRVQQHTGFGATPGLRIDNKIFAMLCRGELVVKLPTHRVDQLVTDGVAGRFGARRDARPMKEWAAIRPDQGHAWQSLVFEALRFVGSRP